MASKYNPGMIFANEENGVRIEVIGRRGSIHGNTSKLTVRRTIPAVNAVDSVDLIQTVHLTNMIRNWKLLRRRVYRFGSTNSATTKSIAV